MRFGKRHTIRIQNHDYSSKTSYLITICTWDRLCLFGDVVNGKMYLNDMGRIAEDEWQRSAEIRRELRLDTFIAMPDHFHGIVHLGSKIRGAVRFGTLGSMIGGYKAAVTRRVNLIRGTPDMPVWQRNFHERILNNYHDIERARQYVRDNPKNWTGCRCM
jgi:REP element-mobilizing transposase RayT